MNILHKHELTDHTEEPLIFLIKISTERNRLCFNESKSLRKNGGFDMYIALWFYDNMWN